MSEDIKKADELESKEPKGDVQDKEEPKDEPQEPQKKEEQEDDKGGQEEKPSAPSLSDDERTELLRYRKMDAIRAAGITNEQDIKNMLDRLEDIDDLQSVQARIDDTMRQLRLAKYKQSADPVSKGNGISRKPNPVDGSEVGREMARRILNKRRGYMR